MAILKHLTHNHEKDYWNRLQYMLFQTTKNKKHFIHSATGAPILRNAFEVRCYSPQGEYLPPEQWEELCYLADYYYNRSFNDSTVLLSHFIIRTKEKTVPSETLFEVAESLLDKYCRGHICLCTMHDYNHVHILLHRIRLVDIEPQEDWMTFNSKGTVADYEYRAGLTFNSSPARIREMKKHLMELCLSRGLHQVDLVTKSKDRKSQGEYYTEKRNKSSYNAIIKSAIREGINTAWNPSLFIDVLETHGVQHEWVDDYVVYYTENSPHPVSGKALGDNYTVEHIVQCLCHNETKHKELLSQQSALNEMISPYWAIDNDDNIDSPINVSNDEGEKRSLLEILFFLALALLLKKLKNHPDSKKIKAEKQTLEECLALVKDHEIQTAEDLDSLSSDKSIPFEVRSRFITTRNKVREISDLIYYESEIEKLCGESHKSKDSNIERF